jgi:hypothetical protein
MHKLQRPDATHPTTTWSGGPLERTHGNAGDRQELMTRRFTILEGLLAIVLLSLILIAAAPLFYYARLLIYRSSIRRLAVERATEKVELLMNTGFDQIQGDEQEIQLGPVPGGMITVVEDAYLDGVGEGYKEVDVILTWTAGGKQNEIVLTTYVSSAAPTG